MIKQRKGTALLILSAAAAAAAAAAVAAAAAAAPPPLQPPATPIAVSNPGTIVGVPLGVIGFVAMVAYLQMGTKTHPC